jgi:hypothetical protein
MKKVFMEWERSPFCKIGFGCELFLSFDKNVTNYATITLDYFEGDPFFCSYIFLINLILNTIFSFSSHLDINSTENWNFFTRFSFFSRSRLSNHELDFSHINFLATLSLLALKFNLNLIMAILITVLSNFRTG